MNYCTTLSKLYGSRHGRRQLAMALSPSSIAAAVRSLRLALSLWILIRKEFRKSRRIRTALPSCLSHILSLTGCSVAACQRTRNFRLASQQRPSSPSVPRSSDWRISAHAAQAYLGFLSLLSLHSVGIPPLCYWIY